MMLWIIIAGMTALVALAVLWPLSRATALQDMAAMEDAGVYQAQINDIERDGARGLLGADEAEALRVEAARRLLRSGEAVVRPASQGRAALLRRRVAALVIAVALPLGGGLIYLKSGSPELPGQPLAARNMASAEGLDVQRALAQIEQHLAANPGDLRGWDLVAPLYLRMGRPVDAARAYQAAITHGGASAERWAALGEARMVAASGMVTADARAAFEEALKLEPSLPKARYGLAMAKQQDGNEAGAVSDLEGLIAAAPSDAAYLPLLRQSLATLKGVPEGGQAIASLPAGERNAAILSMVEGLAERLASSRGSLEEWQRLIRARMVLGDRAAAQTAVATARGRLAPDAAALASIGQLALELGLEDKP